MGIKIQAESGKLIHLGRIGENKAVTIVFNVNDLITNFGTGGQFTLLIFQNGELYTEEQSGDISYNSTNKTVEWNVTDTYTTEANQGRCQLVYRKNDIVAKTEIYSIIVTEAFEEEGDE